MSQEKKGTVGDPIWVESVLTPQEYREAAKKYPASFSNGSVAIQYDPSRHEGGKWRAGMGKGLSAEDIAFFNKQLDNLCNLLKTKKFQKRPDYGPNNEAKP